MTNDYIFDPATRVHGRQGSETFTYSDGEEVEVRLLNAIERARDLSTASEELANEIVELAFRVSPFMHASQSSATNRNWS